MQASLKWRINAFYCRNRHSFFVLRTTSSCTRGRLGCSYHCYPYYSTNHRPLIYAVPAHPIRDQTDPETIFSGAAILTPTCRWLERPGLCRAGRCCSQTVGAAVPEIYDWTSGCVSNSSSSLFNCSPFESSTVLFISQFFGCLE
jgi:hypothetical protein